MEEFIFRGDKEFVKVKITEDKKLLISNNLTGNKFVQLKERLFGNDRNKRHQCKLLLLKLPILNEKEIIVYLTLEFHKMGYALVKHNDNIIK